MCIVLRPKAAVRMEVRTSSGRTMKKVLPAVARSHLSAIVWGWRERNCAGNHCPYLEVKGSGVTQLVILNAAEGLNR